MLRSILASQSLPPVAAGGLVNQAAISRLLCFAGPLVGTHALVIAPNGLDLMCSLLQQGCAAATTLRHSERVDHDEFDLVLVPCVAPGVSVAGLATQAQRALRPSGRLVAFVPTSPHGLGRDTVRSLLSSVSSAGFIDVQIRLVHDGVLVRGSLPATMVPTASSASLRSCA